MNEETLENTDVLVRNLKPADLEAVIALDARITGRRREEFFKLKLKQALEDTGIVMSLAAEVEGSFAGFTLARVYYGEFGQMEQVAVLDTIGVHPDFQKAGTGRALLEQLAKNLGGLGIERLQTEVAWESVDLLAFFHSLGFKPAARLCLELPLSEDVGRRGS